jgi:type VI protein secretion system component Hcp
MRKSVVVTVVTILATAAVATSTDAKTSKAKQQYLQIKLQDATVSSVTMRKAGGGPKSPGKPTFGNAR